MTDEVILEKLSAVFHKLSEISDRLGVLNGKVAEHERWINERAFSIANADGRLSSVESAVSSHQSYIDQRQETLREFEEMRKTLSGHQTILDQQKGGSAATAKILVDIATLAGIIGVLVKLFIHS